MVQHVGVGLVAEQIVRNETKYNRTARISSIRRRIMGNYR